MKVMCVHKRHLLERMRQRGATWPSVAPAITMARGDTVCVDVDHPAYPRQRVGPWPRWVRHLARFRKPTDRGFGDTLERIAGKFGREWKQIHKRIFGRACGCETRRDELNRTYPYETPPAPPALQPAGS